MTEHERGYSGQLQDAWDKGYDDGVQSCQITIAELRAELGSALAEINRLLLAAAALEQALKAAAMWEQRAREHWRDDTTP